MSHDHDHQPHSGGHHPQPHSGGHDPRPHSGGHDPRPHSGGHDPQPHSGGHDHQPLTSDETARFWDQRYAEREQIWSGRVNPVLAAVATQLAPGRVLDLGCGEGGDAVWLADHGWQVTAIDISTTALDRARRAADRAGVGDRISFEQHDLAQSFPSGTYDLVSAQFLQSPVDFPRFAVLQRAAAAVAGGGRMLIVDHGAPPPWASEEHRRAEFLTVQQTLDNLDLPEDSWTIERAETAAREAVGPTGHSGELIDNIILIRRLG
jgi:SAM-dependent methyltransferase